MKLKGCKVIFVTIAVCMGTLLAAGRQKEQSTAQAVASKKHGRAEIDAHVA